MESFIVLPRGLALVLLPFVVGCSHTVTMLPRGGGESGVGTLNDGRLPQCHTALARQGDIGIGVHRPQTGLPGQILRAKTTCNSM